MEVDKSRPDGVDDADHLLERVEEIERPASHLDQLDVAHLVLHSHGCDAV